MIWDLVTGLMEPIFNSMQLIYQRKISKGNVVFGLNVTWLCGMIVAVTVCFEGN